MGQEAVMLRQIVILRQRHYLRLASQIPYRIAPHGLLQEDGVIELGIIELLVGERAQLVLDPGHYFDFGSRV